METELLCNFNVNVFSPYFNIESAGIAKVNKRNFNGVNVVMTEDVVIDFFVPESQTKYMMFSVNDISLRGLFYHSVRTYPVLLDGLKGGVCVI